MATTRKKPLVSDLMHEWMSEELCGLVTVIDAGKSYSGTDPFEIQDGRLLRYHGHEADVQVPDSVQMIEPSAFIFSEITSIRIPDSVGFIGANAFSFCENLEQVRLPAGLPLLSDGLFRCTPRLREIHIPETVRSIGEQAFEQSGIESVVLPKGLELLVGNPFLRCRNLKRIHVDGENPVFESIGDCCLVHKKEHIFIAATKPCAIPKGITCIEEGAFYGMETLESIELPKSLQKIQAFAFCGCTGLRKLQIPRRVGLIEESAFEDCENLSEITVDAHNSVYASPQNCQAVVRIADAGLLVGGTETVVPRCVRQICDYAFSGRKLRKLVLPDSVKEIGHSAFEGSTLEELELCSTVSIAPDAFAGCGDLLIRGWKSDALRTYCEKQGIRFEGRSYNEQLTEILKRRKELSYDEIQ